LFLFSHNNCRLYRQKKKKKTAHTRQLEKKESCYCYDSQCPYILNKEILLTIRRKKCDDDDDDCELKCRNYIRVGHEIQLNEVIENDVCFDLNKEAKKNTIQ
jgi:hypothetical protein